MDYRELLMLGSLHQNSRLSVSALSRCTGLPRSTIHYRLKKPSAQQFSCFMDFGKAGLIHVLIIAEPAKRCKRDFLEALPKGAVNNLQRTPDKYVAELLFFSDKELCSALKGLERASSDIRVYCMQESIRLGGVNPFYELIKMT